jgi:ABC-type oligopeptide transport system substrate-binding subunit
VELAPTLNYYVNLDYTQLAVDYWAQIGVDVEIDIVEGAVMSARVKAHAYEGMTYASRGVNYNPLFWIRIKAYSDGVANSPGNQDPVYDAMIEAAENAGSREEMMELVKESDNYFNRAAVAPGHPEAAIFHLLAAVDGGLQW